MARPGWLSVVERGKPHSRAVRSRAPAAYGISGLPEYAESGTYLSGEAGEWAHIGFLSPSLAVRLDPPDLTGLV